MNSLDQALDEAVKSVPDCLVAGYVDLGTGVLLGVKTAGAFPREALDMVSSTAASLFEHDDLGAVENWLLEGREDAGPGTGGCREFVVMSDQLMHMYTRCASNSDHIVVLIARRSTNAGLLMAKSRRAANLVDNVG